MELIKYLFLGFIQGITEPIPVSSSGHLLIFQKLVAGFDNINFELLATITNFGSLLAIFLIFRKDIFRLFRSFFGYLSSKDKKLYDDYKYCWYVVLASIPAGIIGILVTKLGLFDILEKNIKFVGVTLLITAVFLYIIKDFKGIKEDEDITLKDALIIGLFQVVALVPGISRSGATIVGGMFRKLKRKASFNFSFILYIPISIATSILGVKDLMNAKIDSTTIILYLSSMVVAFIFTYIGTKWFRKIVNEGKLIYFTIYCLIVGFLVILFLK